MKRVPAKFPQQTLLLVWLHSADPRGFPRRPSQDSGCRPHGAIPFGIVSP